MKPLSAHHQKIHDQNISLAKLHTKTERELVEGLIEAEDKKIHKRLGYASMFKYATQELHLSETVALMLIGIARAAKKHQHLRSALSNQKLTPAKASRIVAHITEDSVEEIVDFATITTTARSTSKWRNATRKLPLEIVRSQSPRI